MGLEIESLLPPAEVGVRVGGMVKTTTEVEPVVGQQEKTVTLTMQKEIFTMWTIISVVVAIATHLNVIMIVVIMITMEIAPVEAIGLLRPVRVLHNLLEVVRPQTVVVRAY